MSFFNRFVVLLGLPAVVLAAGLTTSELDFIQKIGQQEIERGKLTEETVSPDIRDIIQNTEKGVAKSRQIDAGLIKSLEEQAQPGFEALVDEALSNRFIAEDVGDISQYQEGGRLSRISDTEPRVFVFISLGMPEKLLHSYFEEVQDRDDVVFLLRGWQPPHLTPVIQKIHALMKDLKRPANVIIDPVLFDAYKVESVPMILAQDKAENWRRIYGDIPIAGAEEEIKDGRFNRQVGRLFAIKEPNILEEIQKRAEAYDWDGALDQAKANTEHFRPGIDLEWAEKDEEYFVDPTITVKQDIYNPQTDVLIAPAGTRVNPLDSVVLPNAYIVFDPESKKQIEIAKAWLKENPLATLIATRYAELNEKDKPISEVFGNAPVYALDSSLVERLGIKASPSLIRQKGNLLHITLKRGIE